MLRIKGDALAIPVGERIFGRHLSFIFAVAATALNTPS